MALLDYAVSTLGRGLAQTAVVAASSYTGYDIGGLLNTLFANGQTVGGADLDGYFGLTDKTFSGTKEQLAAIENSLGDVGTKVTNIGSQLEGLKESITFLGGRIANIQQMLQALKQEILYTQWQIADTNINGYVVAINTSFDTYAQYISKATSIKSALINGFVTDVLNTNVGPKDGLNMINSALLDVDQQKGLLQLWSNMVSVCVANGYIDYRAAFAQYVSYYKKLTLAQFQATTLLMEAYNFEGETDLANEAFTAYRKALLSQEETFIQWLWPLIYSAVMIGNEERTRHATFSAVHASLQMDPGVQKIIGVGEGLDYYEPSELLAKAEGFLASLYLCKGSERRIVIHMTYLRDWGIGNAVDPVQLKLVRSLDGAVIDSSYHQTMPTYDMNFSYLNQPIPDPNLVPGKFTLKRFVFASGDSENTSSRIEGQYKIQNINGQGGLKEIENYTHQSTPFMNPGSLHYSVGVDAAQPFDFMNFQAYVVPQDCSFW